MKKFLLATCGWTLFLSAMTSCSNPSYPSREQTGVSEFVIDSYKIKQGKFAILEMEGQKTETLPQEMLQEGRDILCDGDVLSIALYHPMRTDIVQAVQSISSQLGYHILDNHIVLPDLGAIRIGGLTLEEARGAIQNAYLAHIADVEVFLAWKDRKEKRVELLGSVGHSSVVIDHRMRLFDVLAQAKIHPEANLFKSYVVREGHLLPVDMYKLIKEGDMSQNIVMQGGDKIYLADPASATVMMLGEVSQRGLVHLPNGYISLREALAKAGGIPFTGDKAYIQVIRGSFLQPKIYTLHWKHIIELPTDSMLLMPGDIVYVAATPITEWNRFISQLFPSFTAVDWFSKGIGALL